MAFPERFSNLPDYAFPRLRRLLAGRAPGLAPIDMTIGEPRHPMPAILSEVLAAETAGFARYPPNEGAPELLAAIGGWIRRRYGVARAEDEIMVLNGTREGLFNAALALCPEQRRGRRPAVLMPDPFYPVYAVAARAAGAEPVPLPATAQTGFLPDLDALPSDLLERTAIFYVCSPANPQGAVASTGWLDRLLELSDRHGFRIFADECYSEIWRTAPPPGILARAAATGADPERVFAFNSLSKRSNVPGLRSGFVCGGAAGIAALRRLRAYAGAPVPLPLQRVSAALWADERHVAASLALYQAKFALAAELLACLPGFRLPEGGFFLWLPVPARIGDGEAAALQLWRQAGLRVLPGAYLGQGTGAANPGRGFIRVALVAPVEETRTGLLRLRDCLYA